MCIRDAFGGNVWDMASCYFDILAEHVAKVKPTVVGHFDVITKFSLMPEATDRYRQIAADALKQILAVCPYLEVNTGAIARGLKTQPYPSSDLLEVARQCGARMVLGSDSHYKDNLTFAFDETVQLLKQAGFDSIHVFNGSGFDAMPI